MSSSSQTLRLRPRLEDVATMADVARSTCQAILADSAHCYASEATRKRVFDAADELGYRPNRFASSLRTNRTRQVGFLLPNVFAASPIIGEKFSQIEDKAIARDYRLLVNSHRHEPQRELEYMRSLLADRVDGLLLYTGSVENADLVQQMLSEQFPVVTIESPFTFATPNVRVRRELGGYQQVMHLGKDAGRRNLAFLASATLSHQGLAKLAGHRKALAELGSSMDEHLFIDGTPDLDRLPSEFAMGLDLARRALASGREFDGVVLTSDSFAPGVFKALAEVGRSVPDDVAIVGFDDTAIAEVLPVELTTIRQPRDVGVKAFDLLMRMIDDGMPENPDDFEQIELDPQLIVRESTGVSNK